RPEDLQAHGIDTCKLVLLTHGHRDSAAGTAEWLARGTAVRAGKASAAWLLPAGVDKFWTMSLPEILPPDQIPPLFHRQWAVWAFGVHARGVEAIRCDLDDQQELR